jgi:hypothetical protein
MKIAMLIIGLFLAIQTANADDIADLSGFIGTFNRIEASGGGAIYYCPQQIKTTEVQGEYIRVANMEDDSYIQSFAVQSPACKWKTEGDINLSPILTCKTVRANKLKDSETGLTIVGFIKDSHSLTLNATRDQMIIRKDMTLIPGGVLRIWQDEKYVCKYQRVD